MLQGNGEGVVTRGVPLESAGKKVGRRDAIDEVNLNVDGDAGLTLTVLETVDAEEDEECIFGCE